MYCFVWLWIGFVFDCNQFQRKSNHIYPNNKYRQTDVSSSLSIGNGQNAYKDGFGNNFSGNTKKQTTFVGLNLKHVHW